MHPATLKCLKSAIAHWKENASITGVEDASLRPCALCHRFRWGGRNCELDGEKCPVFAATGEHFCLETPYWDAFRARERDDFDAFFAAAEAELAFLRSLLPTEPPRPNPTYLGDGVYAEFDGWQIWLRGEAPERIALEPAVFEALVTYANLVFARNYQDRPK